MTGESWISVEQGDGVLLFCWACSDTVKSTWDGLCRACYDAMLVRADKCRGDGNELRAEPGPTE